MKQECAPENHDWRATASRAIEQCLKCGTLRHTAFKHGTHVHTRVRVQEETRDAR